MQKNSNSLYSKLAISSKSKGRIYKESKSLLRTDHQRDRDRIIHSTAFRRLKHKTQVLLILRRIITGQESRTRWKWLRYLEL